MKTKRRREKMQLSVNKNTQSTLDSLPATPQKPPKPVDPPNKQIVIAELSMEVKEEELALKVAFKLLPSKQAFSKMVLDLYFNDKMINTINMSLPQSPILTDEFELAPVLDMSGVAAGNYTIKAELYQPWASTQKIAATSKDLVFEYVPFKKEDRYIRIPFVKKIAGTNIHAVSKEQQNIYLEIKERLNEETESKRDQW